MLTSILDNDLYKFTMQQAVLEEYPEAEAHYRFNCRKSAPIPEDKIDPFFDNLKNAINDMSELAMQPVEREFFGKRPYMHHGYVNYLENYRYNPKDIVFGPRVDNLQKLELDIKNAWHQSMPWEVPMMAIISETYFNTVVTDWNMDGQEEKFLAKSKRLNEAGCKFADFGTRRRRSFAVQDMVVRNGVKFENFVGTSNVYLALKYNTTPIGTMAHEILMGVSGLESLRYANRYALKMWNKVYNGDLGIALTDTFGTEAFFEDFDGQLARLFDGVRHDSGNPFVFTDKVIAHYKSLRIDCSTKTIVFSDGLDVDIAIQLNDYCKKSGIKCSFGIGTNFTNDFNNPALNMVIKLRSIRRSAAHRWIPVVKLSDVMSKATGEEDAIRVAKYVFTGQALDLN